MEPHTETEVIIRPDPTAFVRAVNQLARAMHLWRLSLIERRGWGWSDEQVDDWRVRSTAESQARRYLAKKRRQEQHTMASIVLSAVLFLFTLYAWGGLPW